MKLKRLTLQGYKTFATKTEFLFDDGITAVVGPNGSGKSNVADAVRWVLGEQSYGTLRGRRTVDMIFSGSQSRSRAGMAQATLMLDNRDGWLPIDYSEVEIGRRAHRSGENEYFLNGQKVRLRDITDLLATSGLSQRTYTIIGQGLIDQALSLKADERRALFEEAAGINHYKARRAETLRRLQETQRNLQRVHDILAEIRPRLNSLRRQATRAQNYEQVSADLQHLLKIWYGYRWEQAKKELGRARQTAVSIEETWQSARRELLIHQQNVSDLQRQIGRRQQRLADVQDERDDVRDALETARREVAILQERQQSTQRQLQDLDSEIPPLEASQQHAQQALDDALAALQEAQDGLAAQQSQLMQFNAGFEAQQQQINHWQTAQETARRDQLEAQNRLAQTEGQRNQLQERLNELTASSDEALQEEAKQLETTVAQLSAAVRATQNALKTQRQTRQKSSERRQALLRELKQERRDLRDEERQLNKAQSELARLEARVEMLDQRRLKKVQIVDKTQLVGSLASLIEIPEGYETAVSAALKAQLAALIFKNDRALQRFMREDQTGQVGMALDRLGDASRHAVPDSDGIIGWAADLVKAKKTAASVSRVLLGSVLLVESADAAFDVALRLPAGCLAVSPDGQIAYANGAVTSKAEGDSDILVREARWREALAELTVKSEALDKLMQQVETKRAHIQEKQDAVDVLQQDDAEATKAEQLTNQQLSVQQRELDRAQQQVGFVQRQKQQQETSRVRLESRIGEINETIAAQQNAAKSAAARLTEAAEQLAALPVAEAAQQRDTLQQAITSAQTIVAGRQAVVDSRRATLNQVGSQLERLRERRATLQAQLDSAAQANQRTRLKALQEKLEGLDGQISPIRKQLNEHRTELAQFEEKTAVLQRISHDKETAYTQTKIAYTQRKNEIESLQERIKADLGIVSLEYSEDQYGPKPLPMGDIEALPQVTELPDDIAETIQNYRGQLQRMGAINPDAPEEYQETLDRHDFLNQQIDDLNQTEAKLRKIINELDDLTSRAFAETVNKVNAVFQTTFTQLFGGGSGRLVLTDPDDLTISGVDIVAQLPNRREQGLGLLSGGERSLTAAALIFSLLKVSPTPFCIMDEVDAALDEANINRFRELLQELAEHTQFILITHNRGTVQAAQTIYGISMGSDSVSQAISIRPEDYVKQPELI